MILVSDLLRRLGNIMLDVNGVRWEDGEAIDWFNDAASEIVLRRPAARSVKQVITLVAGSHQQCPDGTAQLLDILHNVKADNTADRAIRLTDAQKLADTDPDWRSNRAGKTYHYMVDERAPTLFEVWPPAVAGAKVEALLAVPPPKAVAITDSIDLRAEFINAILNWAMYRCHTKDSEYSQGQVAAQHYQAFTDAIGAPAAAAQQNSVTGNNI